MHPVRYDIEFALERNRLTTFFRLLIAIPWFIVGALYAIAAQIAMLIAWFALLFTGRFPERLYGFIAGFIRFAARLGGFAMLATDELPPFNGGDHPDYPVRVSIAGPQTGYSRSRTFFKLVTAFPQFVLTQGISALSSGAAFISWFRILFTGRQSATMHDALCASLAYQTRSYSFLMLLTEQHPRLLDLPPQDYPPGTPALPAPEAPAGAVT